MTLQEKVWFKGLIERRKSLFNALQDPAAGNMWKSFIDELYSDDAHFVYELLQNADDAEATCAEFILREDELIFKHNGTRKFSISDPYNEKEDTNNGILGDINSITSYGNSNKRFSSVKEDMEQVNKIGKFGIGFKSIFCYTIKPEIFETNFSFRIENIIIPVLLDYDYPERKEDETVFKIPFGIPEGNHLKISPCTPSKAFNEIKEKLSTLDCPTLFLPNLQEVKFKIGDTVGIYKKEITERKEVGDNTWSERLVLTDGKSEKQNLWLFSRKSNGINYSVGFFLDDKNHLKSVNKYAFCFFPTKKETHLNFIIHAPFLLISSREGIPNKEHNQIMIDLLATLAADSLVYLRDIGLIDDGILKIIPVKESDFYCASDEISFKPFFTSVKHKMQSEKLLPTGKGYVSSPNAYWADTKELIEIFSDKQLGEIVQNQNAAWVFKTVTRKDKDVVSNYVDEITKNYLTGTSILEGRNDFYSKQRGKIIQGIDRTFIESQSIEWLHRFYKWLAETSSRYSVAKIKPFFLDTNGTATAAFEGDRGILFLPNDSDYPTVHPDLLDNSETEKFLREKIGVREPELKDEIDKILLRYENNLVANEEIYFKKIFRYYKEECTDEETFIEHLKKVIYFRTLDRKFAVPSVLYMPEPELVKYFSAANLNPFLDKDFYLNLVGKKFETFLLEFFRKLGVSSEVKYCGIEFDTMEVREWNRNNKFFTIAFEEQRGVIRDYNFPYLEFRFNEWRNEKWTLEIPRSNYMSYWTESILIGSMDILTDILVNKNSQRSFSKSIILWRRMIAVNDKVGKLKDTIIGSRKHYFRRWIQEPYTPVNVTLLRETPWLVDKRGDFKSPKDMRSDEMADGYDVTSDSAKEVIAFLGIKESKPEDNRLTDEEKRYIEKGRMLEEVGGTEEEFQEYISQKRAKNQSAKNSPLPPLNDSSPIKLSAKKIHHLDSRQAISHTASEEDYFKSAIIDYGEELKKVKAKGDKEAEKIAHLEELQRKVLDAEKYSFGWCKALLDLEILNSNENNTDNKKVSISFGRVEFDEGTQRTLILKYPNRYIPQFMEDLENIQLVLRTAKDTKTPKTVEIEVVAVRNYTLSAKLKDSFELTDINLNDVVEARIDVNDPLFLIEELRNQFNELGFDDDFNLRNNLCANIEFVFGPPGTGKTTNLADKILKLMSEPENKKILVLTPTNKAADVLVNKIIARAENKSYSNWLLRFGTTNDKDVEESGVFHDKTFDINSKAKNVTVTTIARFPYDFFITESKRTFLREINWDYIIIDEASMIMLAQILLPLYKKTPRKFIIAGDPFQIEPVTEIDLWKDENRKVENIYTLVKLDSFAEPKTIPHNYHVETLNTQYRSIPAIGEIFSHFAYNGILNHARANSDRRLLNIDNWLEVQPLNIIKFPVSKYESIYRSRRLNGKSPYQVYSALFTFEFTKALRERIDKDFSIGIISPYRAQADLIEKLFASTKCNNVQIGTIHTFQGDECDILIAVFNTPPNISSSPEMSLNRQNIINVAISRARDYLFIVMPDDNTDKIENLKWIKGENGIEKLFATDTLNSGEFSAQDIETLIFGEKNYIEENSFATGHQNVNVYARPERKYEIRSEDSAIDIQIHEQQSEN